MSQDINHRIVLLSFVVVVWTIYFGVFGYRVGVEEGVSLDPVPRHISVSGTYVCLPIIDKSLVHTDDCILGLKSDTGEYYMVNFGQSADAMHKFKLREHIKAEGFFVIKEALSTNHWDNYNMKGIFTVTMFY